MNSNIVQQLKQLERFGFYSQDSVRQNGAEIQTALTTSSMKVLEFLAESEDRSVKAAVTMNPFCTSAKIRNFISEILDRGEFSDIDIQFMRLVSRNPKCPGDILDNIVGILAKQESWSDEWREVISLPNIESCTLLRLMEDEEDVAIWVAETTTRQELWMYCPEEYLVENPNCPAELLENIAEKHPYNLDIANKVAANPNVWERTLEKCFNLAMEGLYSARRYDYSDINAQKIITSLSKNPNTTLEILKKLYQHFGPSDERFWRIRNYKNCPSIIKDNIDFVELQRYGKVTTE